MAPHKSGLQVQVRSEEASRLVGALRNLNSKKAQTYLVQGLNRAATELRTEITRAIREKYNARARDVREVLRIKKAVRNKPYATVWGWGKASIPLHAFSPVPRLPYPEASRPKAGVSVLVTRAGGRKVLPGHFIARSRRTGALMVARREGGERYPIKQGFGPGIFQAVKDHGFEQRLTDYGQQRLETNLGRAMDRLLSEAL